MGRDKLALEVGGIPIVRRVYTALASNCDEVLVVGSRKYRLYGGRNLPDLRPGEGPLAGIEAGLSEARNRPVFVAAGDLPFLSAGLVGYLLEIVAGEEAMVALPRHAGSLHPLCAAYDREVLPEVRAALDTGERAVRAFVEACDRVRYVGDEELRRFGDPEVLLMNVNSPADLERARALCGDA